MDASRVLTWNFSCVACVASQLPFCCLNWILNFFFFLQKFLISPFFSLVYNRFFFSRFVCAVEDSSRGEEGGKQNVKERKGVTGTKKKKKKKIQNIQKEEDENSDGRTDIPLLLPFGVGNRHDDKLLDDIHGNGQSRRPQRSLW
jgi:hypothetical protein